MPIFELVDSTERIASRASLRFEARFAELESQLVRRLEEFLSRFSTRGGRFVFDDSTSVLLSDLSRIMEQVMRKQDLRDAVRDLLPDFDRIGENVRMLHGEESGIVVSKALVNDTKNRMVQMTTQTMIDVSFEARFADPVRKLLYNHVNFGAGVLETERALRALITGRRLSPVTLKGTERQRPGLMSQYSGQVARDALHQYEGQVHAEIAQLHDLKNWRYIGNILPGTVSKSGRRTGGTRPQCRRWVKMEIIPEHLLAQEVRWALNNGSGMIPGTTATTWPVFRGGYNCRHKAIPTKRS